MSEPVRRLREVEAYANPFVRVFDDEVKFANGRQGRFLRIEPTVRGLGVVLLAVYEGAVGLVRTYRYPISGWQWGLPRGFAQSEDVFETARAELTEELGVRARQWSQVGLMTPDSGLLSTKVAVMLAEVAEVPGNPTDTEEVAETKWVPFSGLWRMVALSEIQDGFTMAAMALAIAAGTVPPPSDDT